MYSYFVKAFFFFLSKLLTQRRSQHGTELPTRSKPKLRSRARSSTDWATQAPLKTLLLELIYTSLLQFKGIWIQFYSLLYWLVILPSQSWLWLLAWVSPSLEKNNRLKLSAYHPQIQPTTSLVHKNKQLQYTGNNIL